MLTIKDLQKRKVPIVFLKQEKEDLQLLDAQLNLNCWLDEKIVALYFKDKSCHIAISETERGKEALFSNENIKNRFTALPGFYLSETPLELTVSAELKRATEYIARNYLQFLGETKTEPVTYHLQEINVDKKNKKAILTFKKHTLDIVTDEEYWRNISQRVNGAADPGVVVQALAEAREHHDKSSDNKGTYIAWARNLIKNSLYSLSQMMNAHARTHEPEQYTTNQGTYEMDNLLFRVFNDAQTVEKVFNNEQVLIDLVKIEKVD